MLLSGIDIIESQVAKDHFPSLPPSPDNVSVTGRARGGRTHRDTEEGEAEEQTAKVFAFLARESSDFCSA